MAYERIEAALAAGRQDDHMGRLRSIPSPRMVPQRVVDFLRQSKGADYALARVRHETELLDRLESELTAARERRFALQQLSTRVRGDIQIAEQQGRRAETLKGELSEICERMEPIDKRANRLAAMASPLKRRRNSVLRRLSSGEAARFCGFPEVDRRLTLAAAHAAVMQEEAELLRLAASPRTADEVKQVLATWAERETATPAITQLFDRDPKQYFTTERPGMPAHADIDRTYVGAPWIPGIEINSVYHPSLLGLLLWLTKDKFLARLNAEADLLADKENQLSESELHAKLTEGRRRLLAAERIEEALAWRLMQNGEEVALREHADVRAILAIE